MAHIRARVPSQRHPYALRIQALRYSAVFSYAHIPTRSYSSALYARAPYECHTSSTALTRTSHALAYLVLANTSFVSHCAVNTCAFTSAQLISALRMRTHLHCAPCARHYSAHPHPSYLRAQPALSPLLRFLSAHHILARLCACPCSAPHAHCGTPAPVCA